MMPWQVMQRIRLGLERHALARGQIGMQVGGQRRERLQRRLDREAEQPARHEHAAVDRRAFAACRRAPPSGTGASARRPARPDSNFTE